MFNGVKQSKIHPREAGQHHSITPVALPFILVNCSCFSWIGHDHSETQLLQKAAHPRTVHAGFHHRSGAGITSCEGRELFARIAQTSLFGHLSGFVQHTIRVPTVTKVQSDCNPCPLPSGCVIHKAWSLPTRSMGGGLLCLLINLVELSRCAAVWFGCPIAKRRGRRSDCSYTRIRDASESARTPAACHRSTRPTTVLTVTGLSIFARTEHPPILLVDASAEIVVT